MKEFKKLISRTDIHWFHFLFRVFLNGEFHNQSKTKLEENLMLFSLLSEKPSNDDLLKKSLRSVRFGLKNTSALGTYNPFDSNPVNGDSISKDTCGSLLLFNCEGQKLKVEILVYDCVISNFLILYSLRI